MSREGWELTCEGEGHPALLAALGTLTAEARGGEAFCTRVEFIGDEGEERVGDFVVREVDGSVVVLHPWSDEHAAPDPGGEPVSVWVGDVRAVTIY